MSAAVEGDVPARVAEPRPARHPRAWHPFLFATFPIVFVLAHNTAEDIAARDVLVALGVSLAVTAALLAGLRHLIRDRDAAAVATSVVVVLFFSYGHVLDRVAPHGEGSATALRLLALFGLLAVIGVLASIRFRSHLASLTRGINAVAGVLVLLNLVPLIRSADPAAGVRIGSPIAVTAPAHPRDVYYLIFDRYANQRTLLERYGYDDEPFLDGLRARGFFIAEDSVANYPKTAHSLASSLNAELLGGLAADVGADAQAWDAIYAQLQDFRVARAFRSIGYRYVHLGSWWSPTREDPTADRNLMFDGLSEYSSVLLNTTAWPELSHVIGITDAVGFSRQQVERVHFQFRALERIPDDPRPTFTFAHLTLPHPPYVFDEDGDYVPPEEAALDPERAYVNQLVYTNRLIDQLVDRLLAGPDAEDPIIVIQSDEGPHPDRLEADELSFDWTRATDGELSEKLRILNAYYLPGTGAPEPYASISPVNTFRLIFDRYFGGTLPLLPDRSWVFEGFHHPYRFTEVTDRLAADAPPPASPDRTGPG